MRANTYRQWRTEPRAPSVSGAPGGVTCGRMAPSTPSSSPSGAPAAAAVRSCCGQVEPGQEQEQYLAAEALAGFRVESVVWGGTETHWPQDVLLALRRGYYRLYPVPSVPACAPRANLRPELPLALLPWVDSVLSTRADGHGHGSRRGHGARGGPAAGAPPTQPSLPRAHESITTHGPVPDLASPPDLNIVTLT